MSTADIVALCKSISELGILVILGAVFIYAAIKALNLLFEFIGSRIRDKQHDRLLEERTTIDKKVQQLIEVFLEAHHGGRIQVIEFSNSVMSVAYLPFRYMSCTYECYAIGRRAEASRIDHLSTSLFTAFFGKLYDVDYAIFTADDGPMLLGGAMHEILVDCKETKELCTLMTSHTGKNIGFIAFYKDGEFVQDDVEDVQVLAEQISALLGVADRSATK